MEPNWWNLQQNLAEDVEPSEVHRLLLDLIGPDYDIAALNEQKGEQTGYRDECCWDPFV